MHQKINVDDVEAMTYSQESLVECDPRQLHEETRHLCQYSSQKLAFDRRTVQVEFEVVVLLVTLVDDALDDVDVFRMGFDRSGG